MTDGQSFLGHMLGKRLGEIRHMCPECGTQRRALCAVCLGVGHVSEARLARWVREENARVGLT
jgi:hypothetical protein